MPADLVPTLVGLCAVFLAVALSVPQLAKIARTRAVAGVSVAATANSTISFGAWTVYALVVDDGWLLASSVVGLPGQLLTTWFAWRNGAERAQLWLPAAWIVTLGVTTAGDLVLGLGLVPSVVGASVLWYVVPALVHAWRSADVSGIAAASWWVLVAEGAIFLAYGLMVEVLAMVVYGILCLTGSAAVLARVALGDRWQGLGDGRATFVRGRQDDRGPRAHVGGGPDLAEQSLQRQG